MAVELIPLRPASEPERAAVADCLRSGWLTMGPRVEAFEAAFADRLGARAAVAASSNATAVRLALAALGVAAGGRVVVPASLADVAAAGVRALGAGLAFCDIVSPERPVADPRHAERELAAGARAVVAVDATGTRDGVFDLEALCARHGAALLELAVIPAATERPPILGATVFSLAEGTPLAVGEGAVVVTDDDGLASRLRLLRSHGMTSGTWDRHRGHAVDYDVVEIGFNARIDELRVSLATARLEGLDDELGRRARALASYRAALPEGLPLIAVPGSTAAIVLVEDAAAVGSLLQRQGIETARVPAAGAFPRAVEMERRALRLPLAGLSADGALEVSKRLAQALAG